MLSELPTSQSRNLNLPCILLVSFVDCFGITYITFITSIGSYNLYFDSFYLFYYIYYCYYATYTAFDQSEEDTVFEKG